MLLSHAAPPAAGPRRAMAMPPTGPGPIFDSRALYRAIDAQRRARGLTWQQAAGDMGVDLAALTRARGGAPLAVNDVLAVLAWLDRPAESFLRFFR